MPKCRGVARKLSTAVSHWGLTTRLSQSMTSAREGSLMRSRNSFTMRTLGRDSTSTPSLLMNLGSLRCSCGATRRRSATSWPWRRKNSRPFKRSASGNGVSLASSERPVRKPCCILLLPRSRVSRKKAGPLTQCRWIFPCPYSLAIRRGCIGKDSAALVPILILSWTTSQSVKRWIGYCACRPSPIRPFL